MGRRFLEPVARYRSRCVRPSSTFAGCHGAGVQARGPTYVPPHGSRLRRKALQGGLLAPDDLADTRAIQTDKLADVSQRQSFPLCSGEGFAPRLSGSFAVALELALGCLHGFAGGFALGVVRHQPSVWDEATPRRAELRVALRLAQLMS